MTTLFKNPVLYYGFDEVQEVIFQRCIHNFIHSIKIVETVLQKVISMMMSLAMCLSFLCACIQIHTMLMWTGTVLSVCRRLLVC